MQCSNTEATAWDWAAGQYLKLTDDQTINLNAYDGNAESIVISATYKLIHSFGRKKIVLGMYDEVLISKEIAKTYGLDNTVADQNFQTKDFDWELDIYTITPTGRLTINVYYSGPIDHRIRRTAWRYKEKLNEEPQDTKFDGSFEFYTTHDNKEFCYKATFVNGDLRSIHPLEHNAE